MKILNKEEYSKILENIKLSLNDTVWIHHPITEDLVSVNVEQFNGDSITVSIPENSPYFGQPNFKVKKLAIIGKKS